MTRRLRRQLEAMCDELHAVAQILYRVWQHKRAGQSLNLRDDL